MIKDSEKKFQLRTVMVLLGLIGCMSLARAIDRRDNSLVETSGNSSTFNDKSDIDVTRKIRQELVKDSSLSTSAQNIKIVTDAGMVTLRGPVKTTKEKNRIGDITKNIAGKNQVHNELKIKL
jgi:hyperosmotically inducible periplasmic protein